MSTRPGEFLSLFFSSPGDPRDLHSFPTRRSSDLIALDHACFGRFESRNRAASTTASATTTSSATTTTRRSRCTQLVDRKSTRLNSSHSQISYAVFCLKKKTYIVGLVVTALSSYVN